MSIDVVLVSELVINFEHIKRNINLVFFIDNLEHIFFLLRNY